MKTKFKCPKCKGKLIPTEDFFIWECENCNVNLIIQVDTIENKK